MNRIKNEQKCDPFTTFYSVCGWPATQLLNVEKKDEHFAALSAAVRRNKSW